jgi:tetratricopeptide (TPR) repeat protein
MLPDILPLLEDRTRPTHNMIQAHFCLTGESAPVDHLSIRLQVAWLGLFRKPAEQLALVERELAMSNLDEGTEFYWRRYQCEALQRLGRAAEADQPAHRMLVLAEKIEGMPEVDPVDKQRRMARALLATGQTKEAAAAAQRAIEIDRRRGVMTQLWTDQAMLAEIYAQAGQKAECFTLLRALLQVPNGLTVPVLRATPMWDPVRDDPEFKALLNDPKNDTPL